MRRGMAMTSRERPRTRSCVAPTRAWQWHLASGRERRERTCFRETLARGLRSCRVTGVHRKDLYAARVESLRARTSFVPRYDGSTCVTTAANQRARSPPAAAAAGLGGSIDLISAAGNVARTATLVPGSLPSFSFAGKCLGSIRDTFARRRQHARARGPSLVSSCQGDRIRILPCACHHVAGIRSILPCACHHVAGIRSILPCACHHVAGLRSILPCACHNVAVTTDPALPRAAAASSLRGLHGPTARRRGCTARSRGRARRPSPGGRSAPRHDVDETEPGPPA